MDQVKRNDLGLLSFSVSGTPLLLLLQFKHYLSFSDYLAKII